MPCVWRRLKRFARWVYDWITVLVVSLVGAPTLILQLLTFFDGIDITPFVGSETAVKIMAGVALAKGLLAFLESVARKMGWVE